LNEEISVKSKLLRETAQKLTKKEKENEDLKAEREQ